jgi:capsular polysaccharide biosynthesis protein
MELLEYLRILRRRWWIPALCLLLGIAFVAVTYRPPRTAWGASLRFTIGVSADRPVEGVDPILTAYQASEYIRDDFVEILHSEMFASDVNRRLAGTGLTVNKNNISGAVEKQRRIMSMSITWSNPDEARTIAQAAAKALTEENAKYFAQLGSQGAAVAIIDGPDVFPITPGLREQLDVPLRLALALLAGLVLAFLVDYFDDSVRGARDVEALGLPVLGEIPRAGRRPRLK